MSGTPGERPTPQGQADEPPAADATGKEAAPETEAVVETKPATAETEDAAVEVEQAAAEPEDATASEPSPTEPAADAGADEPAPAAATDGPPEPAEERPLTDPATSERPELRAIREALESRLPVEGRVIGWNNGGFHLAIGELSAFCPRSEMEVGEPEAPESYLDKTLDFRVLRIQGKGRRIVVSRAAQLRHESTRQRVALRKKLKPGAVVDGTVTSLTDFGAFVDLGGLQGLIHVSEIAHRRVDNPAAVLSEGQQVRVKVLKVEKGGRRIGLSLRALEPDPWKELAGRFERGAVVEGTVEKATSVGAFIELAPGLTGLLPARSMAIPRQTNPARAYPPGKRVSVQIMSIDPRRQRISLALEGSTLEGSRSDYQEYQQRQSKKGEGDGFNALASAFRRLRDEAD